MTYEQVFIRELYFDDMGHLRHDPGLDDKRENSLNNMESPDLKELG